MVEETRYHSTMQKIGSISVQIQIHHKEIQMQTNCLVISENNLNENAIDNKQKKFFFAIT